MRCFWAEGGVKDKQQQSTFLSTFSFIQTFDPCFYPRKRFYPQLSILVFIHENVFIHNFLSLFLSSSFFLSTAFFYPLHGFFIRSVFIHFDFTFLKMTSFDSHENGEYCFIYLHYASDFVSHFSISKYF